MPVTEPSRAGANAPVLLSSVLSAMCLLLAVALPCFVLYYLALSPASVLAEKLGIVTSLPAGFELAPWQRVAVIVGGAVPVSCMTFGLIHARRCFLSFSRHEYFSLPVVQGLRGFAAGIFFSSIAGLLVTPLASVVISAGVAGGHYSMAFNVSSMQLLLLLFAGMVWQIAAVMTKAVALAEENSQFV